MSVFESKTIGSFLKQLFPLVLAVLFMTPSAADAELLLHNAAESRPAPEIVLQSVRRGVDFGLNENGDLVIRRGAVSMIMAYSPPDEFVEPQERIRIVQRQDCPAISGISLKVSFSF